MRSTPRLIATAAAVVFATSACATAGHFRQTPLDQGSPHTVRAPLKPTVAATRRAVGANQLRLLEDRAISPTVWQFVAEARTPPPGPGPVTRVLVQAEGANRTIIRVLTKPGVGRGTAPVRDVSRSIFARVDAALTPPPDGAPAVPIGTRVRAQKVDGQVLEGILQLNSVDSLVVRNSVGETQAIRLNDVRTLSAGLDPTEQERLVRSRAKTGILVGAFGGILVGSLIPVPDPCPEPNSFCLDFSELDHLRNMVLGSVVGMIAGFAFGETYGKSVAGEWKPVVIPPRAESRGSSARGTTLGLSMRF